MHLLHFLSSGALFIPTIHLAAQSLKCLHSDNTAIDCSWFNDRLTCVKNERTLLSHVPPASRKR